MQKSVPSGNPLDLASNTHIDWARSKEEIWPELEKRMGTIQPARARIITYPLMKLALAASFALLAGIFAFMQFYTRNVTIPAGQHSDIMLPDDSRVQVNAESHISYKPLKWIFLRQLSLEGEAYFQVQPGKKFEVISGNGKTNVLGTSFNIYARNGKYQVTCIAGKVRVSGIQENSDVILSRGQEAALNPNGNLEVQSTVNVNEVLSWLDNKLSFTSAPLKEVFDEIARQYGVEIRVPRDLDYAYTGAFPRQPSIEQVLDLVCKPFNLRFSLNSENEYTIARAN